MSTSEQQTLTIRSAAEVRAGEGRRITFRANTPDVDSYGTIIKPEGIDTSRFEKNPVFLWGHDSTGGFGGPPELENVLGRVVEIHRSPEALDVVVEFADADINPRADQAYRMVKAGFLNGVSISFWPKRWHTETITREVDGQSWSEEVIVYDESELAEISLVPLPSNPNALALVRSMARAAELEVRGVVPRDVSRKTAPEGEDWKKPTLSDFTDQPWGELSDAQKRRIAGHYAWAASMPPERFGDLKLPHHRPSDGAVVWNGVRAAMAALLGARGGVDIPDTDRRKVYDHLASHYRQFDREPPEFRYYTAEELDRMFAEPAASAPPTGADAAQRDVVEAVRSIAERLLVRDYIRRKLDTVGGNQHG